MADFDNDGSPDLFVANSSDQPDQIWLNDGSGTFTDSGQELGNSSSDTIELDDIDDDGDVDAVVVGASTTVWLNDGSGTFVESDESISSSSVNAVDMGDLDGDGDSDIFLGTGTGEENEVLLNVSQSNYTIGTTGGTITEVSDNLTTTIEIPADMLTQDTEFTYTTLITLVHALDNDLEFVDNPFQLESTSDNPFNGQAVTVTMYYEPANLTTNPLLYYYDVDDNQWQDVATTCTPNSSYGYYTNYLQVGLCHLTEFALVENTAATTTTPTVTPSVTVTATPQVTQTPTITITPNVTQTVTPEPNKRNYLPVILKNKQ